MNRVVEINIFYHIPATLFSQPVKQKHSFKEFFFAVILIRIQILLQLKIGLASAQQYKITVIITRATTITQFYGEINEDSLQKVLR